MAKKKDISNIRVRVLHQKGLTNLEIAEVLKAEVSDISKVISNYGLKPNAPHIPEKHIWTAYCGPYKIKE